MDVYVDMVLGAVALVVTAAATPLLSRAAPRLGLLDIPDERKRHAGNVPLCGLAIALGVAAGVVLKGSFGGFITAYLIGSLLLVALGLLDDRRGLSRSIRLIGQVLAAGLVTYAGMPLLAFPVDLGVHSSWMDLTLTVVFLVATINAVNFFDGLDGLACGCALLSLAGVLVVFNSGGNDGALLLAWSLLGAILAFLVHNLHPASVFMGDAGSTFVGFSLGVTALMGLSASCGRVEAVPAVLIIGVPLLDMGAVIFERLRRGLAPYNSDRNHLHHKLLALGVTHGRTVAMIWALQGMVVLAGVLTKGNDIARLAIVLLLVTVLVRMALAMVRSRV
jgi:UDP-GlcNAc:undecaprenyl-phosphate GlcNAc-1-phosphate transferase